MNNAHGKVVMHTPLFYKPQKAIFGLDVGRASVKVAQLTKKHNAIQVAGYGFTRFDPTATEAGVIVKPEVIAQAISNMIKHGLVGHLSTDRIVASLPTAHIYTRILNLPDLNDKDLSDAIKLEAEQYIPLPADELYLEYKSLGPAQAHDPKIKSQPTQAVLMVATPQKIVASYLGLFELLKLEVSYIEANMFANLRAVGQNCPTAGSRIVIDVGAASSDMAIYDHTIQIINTVAVGGDNITQRISEALKVTPDQAGQLQVHYGIAKSRWQNQLAAALEPILSSFANEVQKMTRYQHEHSMADEPVKQIVLVGGGANLPGLADFLTHLTGIETLICNPWQKLMMGNLQPPALTETTIYATVVGLALKQFDSYD